MRPRPCAEVSAKTRPVPHMSRRTPASRKGSLSAVPNIFEANGTGARFRAFVAGITLRGWR
jgi:hypothetical protein